MYAPGVESALRTATYEKIPPPLELRRVIFPYLGNGIGMKKKLYRSEENKILFGICGGIAEYLEVDPVIIRVGLVVLCLLGFSGILAYIIALFIIPRRPETES